MGGPAVHWVSGQANRFYLRFARHAKPPTGLIFTCSPLRGLYFHRLSLSLFSFGSSLSDYIPHFCFLPLRFHIIPLPHSSPSSSPFNGSILNLARPCPVSELALPFRQAGARAKEPMFSRPFLWMKCWNKGMKALGKVWKLPIHQCKEILH